MRVVTSCLRSGMGLYNQLFQIEKKSCSNSHESIYFVLFIATANYEEYDILDPHPAASLDLNIKLKSSTEGIVNKRQHWRTLMGAK